jgi:hypothetical protein
MKHLRVSEILVQISTEDQKLTICTNFLLWFSFRSSQSHNQGIHCCKKKKKKGNFITVYLVAIHKLYSESVESYSIFQ